MMGQPRQRWQRCSDCVEADLESEEWHNAGYIDEPKKESYLPDSVHGSPHHMAALAKNALVLVSEYGCPRAFTTLTCNPQWPVILSQLINGQSAYDCPDVTVPVVKSRLDQIKTNIRHGKYFQSCDVVYTFHMIEYQYRGLPHAHMILCLDNAHDINANNCEDLFDFVNRNFIAEMPQFKEDENQNVHW